LGATLPNTCITVEHKNIRDKLHGAITDFKDINLDSEVARDALIDRIISLVQAESESCDPKYWNLSQELEKARDRITGKRELKSQIEVNSPYNDGWTKEFYQKQIDENE